MNSSQPRPKAIAVPWGRRAASFMRWRLRNLLRMRPARSRGPAATSRVGTGPGRRHRIAYLFAGTYGDFVQALEALNRLASAFPQSELILWGGRRYVRDFASELPPSLRPARSYEPWRWALDPVDLLFVNCVGVYRVRFDFAAVFCARSAYGFRHSHERDRGGYARSLPLTEGVRNFAEQNLKLLDLAGLPDWEGPGGKAPDPGLRKAEAAWGKGGILFLIGSAGLKRDFGLETYASLITGILEGIPDRPCMLVAGPGDEDIASLVRARTGLAAQSFPLPGLIGLIRSFEGTILCFNSFSAHICRYLGRAAIVLHREEVPYGYDCAPLHRQIVLHSERNWDLGDLRKAIDEARSGEPSA